MSDFTTTLQDAYREFCIQAHGVGLAIRSRVADQQGQTAAEYMGILLVVAVIIGALLASHIDTRIAKAAGDMVDKIAGGGGKKPTCRNQRDFGPAARPGACAQAPGRFCVR
jgi:Flp pilus assembly pilin Flp